MILRKAKAAYEFSESKEKINHILFMDDLQYKILWDFSIQTDRVIEARTPDLIVVDKKESSCKIIDFTVPGDSRIEEKKIR